MKLTDEVRDRVLPESFWVIKLDVYSFALVALGVDDGDASVLFDTLRDCRNPTHKSLKRSACLWAPNGLDRSVKE
ncbi:hypothetical protein M407DRAFT_25992 [Tulasnella calospora MUT 4182]|uniref:Uncharacterized protein n=1 Tax=Tulasnella calospora MUT 4182 TaxID=1051891 RepID=A0A0C3QF46_9AGAM|nr:hypothetical protein M407DRAFT_25992 [Tulasnella calospora MUT 4182]